MTNILKRIKYTIEAEIHGYMDKKQQKNPIAMLNQYVREAEKKATETAKLLERQAELKREIERQVKDTSSILAKREEQYSLAKATEDTELIAFAEQEITAYSQRKQEMMLVLEQTQNDYYQLEQTYETMKHKIADMKVRQLSLMGKENAVHAQHKMNQVITTVQVPDFREMDTYIDQLSYKIDKDYKVSTLETRLDELTKK